MNKKYKIAIAVLITLFNMYSGLSYAQDPDDVICMKVNTILNLVDYIDYKAKNIKKMCGEICSNCFEFCEEAKVLASDAEAKFVSAHNNLIRSEYRVRTVLDENIMEVNNEIDDYLSATNRLLEETMLIYEQIKEILHKKCYQHAEIISVSLLCSYSSYSVIGLGIRPSLQYIDSSDNEVSEVLQKERVQEEDDVMSGGELRDKAPDTSGSIDTSVREAYNIGNIAPTKRLVVRRNKQDDEFSEFTKLVKLRNRGHVWKK